MDPDETLRRLRAFFEHDTECDEARDLFTALDEWLSRGGFLPAAWCQARRGEIARASLERPVAVPSWNRIGTQDVCNEDLPPWRRPTLLDCDHRFADHHLGWKSVSDSLGYSYWVTTLAEIAWGETGSARCEGGA